ncbi:hypothetical protein E2C01_099036 [Portunus trituberculatus]|uniref:Uncharacterized protein n=1 Tax=Portunus trituberculatus TaxID=210409 RepID=A0A5B7KDT6_PORTR|nr:hypothetical protein [Portunus trituberculatus]
MFGCVVVLDCSQTSVKHNEAEPGRRNKNPGPRRGPKKTALLGEAIYITNSENCINKQVQNFQVLPSLKQKTAMPQHSQ